MRKEKTKTKVTFTAIKIMANGKKKKVKVSFPVRGSFPIKKQTKEARETEIAHTQFNDGRSFADKKWVDAIDKRIAEHEKETGITELKRLRDKTKYRWKE